MKNPLKYFILIFLFLPFVFAVSPEITYPDRLLDALTDLADTFSQILSGNSYSEIGYMLESTASNISGSLDDESPIRALLSKLIELVEKIWEILRNRF
ncbi:hypothetical protein DYD21_11435 [Rhodohalobacter sp. SW132]|uniref:hypothetical protein n=1 Tax=Rhodohalobacter sp. SW132 TaxID=2293433 RepID=UPI000E23D822|nr:hypothetical protein [Rhodohalobacter sp. SW132]REL33383.1 hypothetical protein DYD21_11435 [Rhodohalobacter sp. SW132]